jgi:tetratricopeptide (TPR) repeat protein
MVSRTLLYTVLAIAASAQIPAGLRTPTQTPTETRQEITPELRGDIAVARKQYREAIEFYKTGADKSPVLANKVGISYHQLQDLDNAKRWYQRAIKLKRDYPEALNNLGTVYYAQKSYKRAIDQYRKALRVTPNSASVLSNIGTAYFARKKYEEAMQFYQQALKADPNVFETRSSQGSVVQNRSVEEKAKFDYYLAKTYAKQGEVDRALQYIRRSLEEGFKEKSKFMEEPEFALLQENLEFKRIMALEQNVL